MRKLTLTIEMVAALVAVVGASIGIWANVQNNSRHASKDLEARIEKTSLMQNALSDISNDVKEIKADMKQTYSILNDHEFRLRELERVKDGGD